MIASQKNMEWEGAGVPEAPTAPDSLRQAGLSLNFLNDLLMRTLYVNGVMLGLDIARQVCLPFKVIEESLKFLKDEKCVEVQGGDLIGRVSYRFMLTELGRRRAQDSMKVVARCSSGSTRSPLRCSSTTVTATWPALLRSSTRSTGQPG